MESVYDRVRDFCPKCFYCDKIFLNRQLLAHHFLTQHLLCKNNKVLCPHCIKWNENMLAHCQIFHKEKCLFCGMDDKDETHYACTNVVKEAIKNYFQKKISHLLNLLEGLENI